MIGFYCTTVRKAMPLTAMTSLLGVLLAMTSCVGHAQWVATNGPGGGTVWSLVAEGDTLLAGTSTAGVFRSTNAGGNWISANGGLNEEGMASMIIHDSTVLGGGFWNGGIYRTIDNGTTWNLVDSSYAFAFSVSDPYVFAGAEEFLRSSDDGLTWEAVSSGLPILRAMVVHNGSLFAGTDFGVYRSLNDGESWAYVDGGGGYTSYQALGATESTIFAAAGGTVWKSTNNGSSWTFTGLLGVVNEFLVDGSSLFAGTTDGAYVTTDEGLTWTNVKSISVEALATTDSNILLGTSADGVYSSSDTGRTWAQINAGLAATWNTNVVVSGENVVSCVLNRGPYLSNDAGLTWVSADSGLGPNSTMHAFLDNGPYLFAATESYGLNRSGDHGKSWQRVDNGLSGIIRFHSLTAKGPYVFAGSAGGGDQYGLFRSSDSGDHWEREESGLANRSVTALASNSEYVFAGTWDGVYRSSNDGVLWDRLVNGIPLTIIYSLGVQDSVVLASGIPEQIYRSSDNGGTWANVADFFALSIVSVHSTFFAAGSGVHMSTNAGITWIDISRGLLDPDELVFGLATDSTALYAATGNGVWKRPLSEIVSVNEQSGGNVSFPSVYTLYQNYPNPFNPSTTFSFTIPARPAGGPQSSIVNLRVFDLLGREVATIVNERLDAGSYSRQWDATGMPSGVYFYRLQAGGFTETKKLVLLR